MDAGKESSSCFILYLVSKLVTYLTNEWINFADDSKINVVKWQPKIFQISHMEFWMFLHSSHAYRIALVWLPKIWAMRLYPIPIALKNKGQRAFDWAISGNGFYLSF